MAVLTAAIWSLNPVMLKVALQALDAASITFLRFAGAALMVGLVLGIRGKKPLAFLKKPPLLSVLSGVCLFANYFGFIKGVDLSGPTNTQIIIQFAPVGFLLAGVFIFKERFRFSQGLGLIVVLAGYAFYYNQMKQAASDGPLFDSANLWILFAAVAWVCFAVLQKMLTVKYSAQHLNMLLYAAGAVSAIPFTNFAAIPELSLYYAFIIFLCSLSTAVAYGTLAEAFRAIPASTTSVIISVNPLGTALIMFVLTTLEVSWIAPDPIPGTGYLGAVVVVCGVLLVVYRKGNYRKVFEKD